MVFLEQMFIQIESRKQSYKNTSDSEEMDEQIEETVKNKLESN